MRFLWENSLVDSQLSIVGDKCEQCKACAAMSPPLPSGRPKRPTLRTRMAAKTTIFVVKANLRRLATDRSLLVHRQRSRGLGWTAHPLQTGSNRHVMPIDQIQQKGTPAHVQRLQTGIALFHSHHSSLVIRSPFKLFYSFRLLFIHLNSKYQYSLNYSNTDR